MFKNIKLNYIMFKL